MKKTLAILAFALLGMVGLGGSTSAQEKTVMVGGNQMYPSKNIVENAMKSADHTTLVAAVKAAGLVPTLEGSGPFTVFAPVNSAFDKLPAGTVNTLLKPENHDTLVKILTYHVVRGKYSVEDLDTLIQQGNGTATLKTVGGGTLTFRTNRDRGITIQDEKGGTAQITIPDVFQSNGAIQVIDTVLMPG